MGITAIADRQIQSVIAGHVAGANWGQNFCVERIFIPTETGGEKFTYETWDNSGLVSMGRSVKRGLRAKTKHVDPPKNGSITASLEEYADETTIDYREINAAKVQDRLRGAYAPADGLTAVERLQKGAAMKLDLILQIEKEIDGATLLQEPTNYQSALTFGAGLGNAAVNFAATGIINTIYTVKRAVGRLYGFEPDTMWLGYTKFLDLLNNPDLLARVSGGATNVNPAAVDLSLIAGLFGLKEIVVTSAITQTPAAPATSPTTGVGVPTDIWTATSAGLTYSAQGQTPDLSSPAMCKMFTMTVPETNVRKLVQTWMSPNGKLEHIETTEFALPAICMAAGALFTA
jgi:hypothetical protein